MQQEMVQWCPQCKDCYCHDPHPTDPSPDRSLFPISTFNWWALFHLLKVSHNLLSLTRHCDDQKHSWYLTLNDLPDILTLSSHSSPTLSLICTTLFLDQMEVKIIWLSGDVTVFQNDSVCGLLQLNKKSFQVLFHLASKHHLCQNLIIHNLWYELYGIVIAGETG